MRLVIFDADGTLVDSQAIIHEAMRLVFIDYDHVPPSIDATRSIIGLTLNLAIAKLLGRPIDKGVDGYADEHIEAMTESYKERYFELQKLPHMHAQLYDGIIEVIDILSKQSQTLLAIATGKSSRGLNLLIDSHGFREKLVAWRSADDCPSKPHPAMILECCEEAGCAPSRTVMIGDSSYDMEMAGAAGTRALGVSWGYQSVTELEKSGAHAIVHKPVELHAAIDTIFCCLDQ